MTGQLVTAPAALGISYRTVLDKEGRRELVFQGHLPIEAELPAVNGLCDLMGHAADRQSAIYELRATKAELQRAITALTNIERDMLMVEEKSRARWIAEERRGEWSTKELTAQERNARSQLESSTTRYQATVGELQERVQELQRAVDEHASNGATDRNAGLPEG